MNKFLANQSKDGLSELAGNKAIIESYAKKISKFIEDNELELPKKFTYEDGGIATGLFINAASNAEEVLEYLS